LAQDASPMIKANADSVFPTVEVIRDPVFKSLTQSNSTDAATIQLLQLLCMRCIDVMGRQLQSQLPGGEFWQASEETIKASLSSPVTTIGVERTFGIADSIRLSKPNCGANYLESMTMFSQNQTLHWLAGKSNAEKKELIELAQKIAKLVQTQSRVDKTVYALKVQQRLVKSRKSKLDKEDGERKKLEKWLEILFENGGLWLTEESMNDHVSNISRSKGKQLEILKAQYHVWVDILKVPSLSKISNVSVEQMKAILSVVIASGRVPSDKKDIYDFICCPQKLADFDFIQRWEEENVKGVLGPVTKWYNGHIVSVDRTPRGLLDFKVVFNDAENTDPVYMAPEEIIVDIMRGDLDLIQV